MTETLNPDSADKRGYLDEPFRLFSLKSTEREPIDHHYHEFHKVVLFLSGYLSYRVEGRRYHMRSGDLLLVPAHAIHQPIIDPNTPYERSILWIQPDALSDFSLDSCFQKSLADQSFLIPRERVDLERLRSLLGQIEECTARNAFGDAALAESLFIQVMVYINRWTMDEEYQRPETYNVDARIDKILAYINTHLTEDLSVETLSNKFFLSRSWLMHRFKDITGCPLHQYVLEKRLILATQYLRSGYAVGEAALKAGFADYSTFLRAFRKTYDKSPRDF